MSDDAAPAAEISEDGDYVVIRVRKDDLGSLSELPSSAINPGDIMGFWGSKKEYCARCSDGRKEPITAKNSLEAAVVGIAKCGGPCQVSRGGCG